MKKYGWIIAILKANWANMLSHRGAFWSMAILMCVQNLIYFSLWGIVFARLGSLRGWGLPEMAFLFGGGALGYGMVFMFLGGINQLGYMIQNGELDLYLARPRSPLWLALMSRMRADSIGDLITGVVMLAVFVRPVWADLPLILVLTLSAGLVFAAARLIAHSLAFWGLGGDGSENIFMAFLIAGTNPQNGFGFWGKFLLLTLLPAGYIGLLPVEILRAFDWRLMLLQIVGSLAVLGFALWLFRRGLRRYRSGNGMLVLR